MYGTTPKLFDTLIEQWPIILHRFWRYNSVKRTASLVLTLALAMECSLEMYMSMAHPFISSARRENWLKISTAQVFPTKDDENLKRKQFLPWKVY